MSYSRPAYNAADASWVGAATYSRPAYNAADASWQPSGPNTAESSVVCKWIVSGASVEQSVVCAWDNNASVEQSVVCSWQINLSTEQSVVCLWSVAATVEQSVVCPWRIDLEASVVMPWSKAVPEASVLCSWTTAVTVEASVVCPYNLNVSQEASTACSWDILNYNPAEQSVLVRWENVGYRPPLTFDDDFTFEHNGVVIGVNSCSISADENSWAWTLNAEIAKVGDWRALRSVEGVNQEVTVTVRGQVFNFLIDGLERSVDRPGIKYSARGRSMTAKLSGPIAAPISKQWPATTAATVAAELCSNAGLSLDWQTVDWPLSASQLAVQDRFPIDIIKMLAEAAGAVVQTAKSGDTLIVQPRFLTSPTKYDKITPDHALSDLDDYQSLTERYEHRPGYNTVEISNQRTGAKQQVILSDDQNGRRLRVWVVPFGDVTLLDSAEGNIALTYQGTFTEQVDDQIEIIDGKGRLTSPHYGTLSTEWVYADLGALTIEENGDLSCAGVGQSVLKISYTTKYHQYSIAPGAGVDVAQVFINEN